MTNMLLSEFTGNMFPRGMGNPYRANNFKEYYIANSITDVEEFIDQNNETNCYITVYPFTEYTQMNRNKMSAIINTIPFDFDSDDLELAFKDLKTILSWCKRHSIEPRIYCTSHKGFHLYVDIEPIVLVHPQQVLAKFGKEIAKSAGLKTLDTCLFGDLERIIRLPNTKHKDTGLYCIGLNNKLIPFLTVKNILKLAERKSDYVPIRKPVSGDVHKLLRDYDKIVDVEIEEMKIKIEEEKCREQSSLFPGLCTGIVCPAYRYYTENGADEGIRDYILCGILHKLRSDGFTKDKIFRELQLFGEKCNPPLNESYIRNRLDSHFVKSYSLCTFFSKVSDLCIVCPNRKF